MSFLATRVWEVVKIRISRFAIKVWSCFDPIPVYLLLFGFVLLFVVAVVVFFHFFFAFLASFPFFLLLALTWPSLGYVVHLFLSIAGYRKRLPNLVNVSWLQRISRGIFSQSESEKYSEWIISSGAPRVKSAGFENQNNGRWIAFC